MIGGLVLCLIGLALFIISPVTLWTFTEKWKTQGGERPSKEYTILIRILGAVFAVAGGALAANGSFYVFGKCVQGEGKERKTGRSG